MMEREVPRMWILPVEDWLLRQVSPVTTLDVVLGLYTMYPDYFAHDADTDYWVPAIRKVLRRLSRDGVVAQLLGGQWFIVEEHRAWLTERVRTHNAAEQYKRDRRAYVLAAQAQVAAGGELPPHPDTLDRNFNARSSHETGAGESDQRLDHEEAMVRGHVLVRSGMYRVDCD